MTLSYWVQIPAVLCESDHSKALLYGTIANLARKNGHCYARNKFLAKSLGLSLSTLKRKLKDLIDEGWLVSVGVRESRVLSLVMPNVSPPSAHDDLTSGQNVTNPSGHIEPSLVNIYKETYKFTTPLPPKGGTDFNKFWDKYPTWHRRRAKKEICRKRWNAKKSDEKEKVLFALETMVDDLNVSNRQQYLPMSSSFLNDWERWLPNGNEVEVDEWLD